MLTPSVVELLEGVADVLAAEVVEELAPGPARDQLRTGIAIVRRVARALPGLTPYLLDDIADLADTLAELGVACPAGVRELPATVPGVGELTALDLRLRAELADAAERAEPDTMGERVVRAALARLTEREARLQLSPWER